MPYLDPYIDAETPEEYEKIIKKLREEQEILKRQLENTKKLKNRYLIAPILIAIPMWILILHSIG